MQACAMTGRVPTSAAKAAFSGRPTARLMPCPFKKGFWNTAKAVLFPKRIIGIRLKGVPFQKRIIGMRLKGVPFHNVPLHKRISWIEPKPYPFREDSWVRLRRTFRIESQ